mmetsp:Transcript_16701/g.32509  ORF Transcript_16701/g.32509 Transcript_16701/m.32509 type:complete len:146 (+) Transcript_16701:29-466(+)|eukprot:CAMPEP_0175168238 /NCGR_PEP_ID=MMETSP0087-20121206/28841_1 /TAXON_ID=136419 /ORGANISM="Unknown Unknown, Strain D1" /LENGTH=145 /DNA_ID=CAMNT_0016458325 /DNA_START=24 /DNA_END=461 /DNA_ORIENTATION=-
MSEPLDQLVTDPEALEILGQHAGSWDAVMARSGSSSSELEDIAALLKAAPGVKWDADDVEPLQLEQVRGALVQVVEKDMAYQMRVCSEEKAQAVVEHILGQFNPYQLKVFHSDGQPCSNSDATFDRGFVFIDSSKVGVLVVEDED